MAVRLALPATSFCFLKLHTPSRDCEHPICNSNMGVHTHTHSTSRGHVCVQRCRLHDLCSGQILPDTGLAQQTE